jgi:hypothetical protein
MPVAASNLLLDVIELAISFKGTNEPLTVLSEVRR